MTSPTPTTLRVLVVDDHRHSAEALGELLAVMDCDVRTAFGGLQALGVAPAFAPHLVILDIQMPGIDGFETARRLRDQAGMQDAMLVTYSGLASPDIVHLSRAAGCDRHLPKPVEFDALVDVLRRARVANRLDPGAYG